jgi:hypothetical protein
MALLEVDLSGLSGKQIRALQVVPLRRKPMLAGEVIYSTGYPDLHSLPIRDQRLVLAPNERPAGQAELFVARGRVAGAETYFSDGMELRAVTSGGYHGQSGGPIFDRKGRVAGLVRGGGDVRETFEAYDGHSLNEMSPMAESLQRLVKRASKFARRRPVSGATRRFLSTYAE